MAKKTEKIVLVKCLISSVEPDYAQYKPTKPVVMPQAFVVVPIPDTPEFVQGYDDESKWPVLTLAGWSYLLSELRAEQQKIYG